MPLQATRNDELRPQLSQVEYPFDANSSLGNIEISVEGCIDNCDDTYKVAVPRGDTGLGEVGELPLDIYAPRSFLAGDPCAPSSYSAGSTAGYENCHNIQVLDILDKLDDHKVGIVFAPSY